MNTNARASGATQLETSVAAHYGIGKRADAIFAALKAAGANPDAPTLDQLAPVDEFHTAGRITTERALKLMPLEPGMRVLDAGCGIGGTARYLAQSYKCRVTGVDLTPEYIEIARDLTRRTGLSEDCTFEAASVLALPFEASAFDAAITFHVAMNVEDRAAFYAELARVLRPGAWLCVFDVMKGPTPGMRYPVPWAETERTSFLKSVSQTRELLEAAGFRIEKEDNVRDFAREYFKEQAAKSERGEAPPPVGLQLLTGENSRDKFGNYVAALEDHQIEPVILIAAKR